MCVSGDLRQTTSGGLSPSVKVASLLRRNWGFVMAPTSRRVKIPVKLGMLGAGAVAATSAMVSLVQTWAWVVVGGKVGVPCAWFGVPCAWFWVGVTVGVPIIWDGAGGKVGFPFRLVLVRPA